MTKKSEARLKRDDVRRNAEQQQVKNPYDQLNELYQHQMGLFVQYRNLAVLIGHPEVAPFVKEVEHCVTLIRGMKADIDDLTSRTQTTYSLHGSKQGWPNPEDEDEHYLIMQLQSDYIMYLGVHQQNLIPILLELQEHLERALTVKQEYQAQAIAAATVVSQQQPAGVEAVTDPYQQTPAELPVQE